MDILLLQLLSERLNEFQWLLFQVDKEMPFHFKATSSLRFTKIFITNFVLKKLDFGLWENAVGPLFRILLKCN